MLDNLYKILNKNYIVGDLKDGKGSYPIIAKQCEYLIFQFDKNDERLFFPFFDKKTQIKYLFSRCDYLIFSTREEKNYVFVIELKSSDNTKNQKQLESGYIFSKYIIDTYNRVFNENIKVIHIKLTGNNKTHKLINSSRNTKLPTFFTKSYGLNLDKYTRDCFT